MPLEKPIEAITEDDIRNLEANQVVEGTRLDYKEKLNIETGDEKREFLADITAFANSAGGDILYGVREEKGKGWPAGIPGIDIPDPDRLMLQITSIVNDGVSPRVRVHLHIIALTGGKSVLIVRIPQSWAAPHRVERGDYRYCGRAGSSRYVMDVAQTRRAFLQGVSLAEQIREFRTQRLMLMENERAPVALSSPSVLVVHVIPVNAFDGEIFQRSNDISIAGTAVANAMSVNMSSPSSWRNLDGLVLTDITKGMRIEGRERANWYYQLFLNGILEAACPIYRDKSSFVDIKYVEDDILKFALHLLRGSVAFNGDVPVFVVVSLLNVQGLKFSFKTMSAWSSVIPVDRHIVSFPEIRLDSAEVEAESLIGRTGTSLRPICDMLWYAAGRATSPYFNSDGSLKHDLR